MKDWLEQTVTAGEPATIAGINDFVEGFLSYENRAANILKAVEAEPDAPLANAYAAIFYMFLESTAAPALAEPFLRRAEAGASKANDRERRIIRAVRSWVDNDIPTAILLGEEIIARWGLLTGFMALAMRLGRGRDAAFWIANAAAALLFALGHFGALFAMVAHPSAALMAAVVLGNFVPAMGFGWLYRRHGIESAMLAHGGAHALFCAVAAAGLVAW